MKKPSNNFYRSEYACKCGCGFDVVDFELAEVLQDVRDHYGKVVIINSACRCRKHNKKIKGSPTSQHLWGKAADIQVVDVSPMEVWQYLYNKYPYKYGIGKYPTFVHIDVRPAKARWHGQ